MPQSDPRGPTALFQLGACRCHYTTCSFLPCHSAPPHSNSSLSQTVINPRLARLQVAAVHKTALYDASVQQEANLATKRILSELADVEEAEDLMQEIAEAFEEKLAASEGPDEDRCVSGCSGRAKCQRCQVCRLDDEWPLLSSIWLTAAEV